MKKGELKKQEILRTAEELFCTKGYEQTSVQDIIDRLNTSKGSFYHHFESKESLLAGICAARACRIYSAAESEAEKYASPLQKLNVLLSGMIPLQGERLRFLMMLLPVFMLPEGKTVRQYYCDALSVQFRDSVRSQIEAGHLAGELYCTDPENASSLILLLINGLWVSITDKIIQAEMHSAAPDLSGCLKTTDCCRNCIERFLSVPYGSLTLVDLPALRLLAENICNHWTR